MYEAGDLIMYGGTGVCKVESVTSGIFDAEDDRKYYVLQPLYQTGTIYSPVDNRKIFMRPIISAEEARALIDEIPEIESEVFRSSSIQQLSKHYQEAIDTNTCYDWVELAKSIRLKSDEAKKNNRSLGQIDKKFKKKAEDLLFGEIAAALNIPREDVYSYISERIGFEDNNEYEENAD